MQNVPKDADPSPAVLVQNSGSYIDSIHVHRKRLFDPETLKYLHEHCGSIRPRVVRTYKNRVIASLWLHQPDPEALARVDQVGASIGRVHIALDLQTADRLAARALHTYLKQHLVTCMRPRNAILEWEDTTYFEFAAGYKVGKQLVLYSDRPSKAEDGHCCHVESRLSGSRCLTAHDMREPLSLIDLDHRVAWKRLLRLLESPSQRELGDLWAREQMYRSRRVRWPWGSRAVAVHRVGNMLHRAVMDNDCSVSASDLLWHLPRFGIRLGSRLFSDHCTEWLLPQCTWQTVKKIKSGQGFTA